jgi:predicted Zn finger-like uncharacterized protein
MFTVCPKCALTLVVTPADLRIAQGYVRCGRCLNVFNALARLSEERPGVPPEPASAGEPPEQPAAREPPAPSTVDDTGEIEVELDAASVLVTSVRAPTAPQETAESVSPVDSPGASATPEPIAPEPIASEPIAPVTSQAAPAMEAAVEPLAQAMPPDAAQTPVQAEGSEAQRTNIVPQQPKGAFELEPRRLRVGLAWKLGTGVLVIALALQVVNHYRDSLAAHPAFAGPLSALYSALGVKLAPRWDIHAYDVRQLGASVASAAAGEIIVRASVKNSAPHAQPLPLLRVTLQDRFGNRVAARDVPPDDYLPSSAARHSLLAAGGRVDATMVFVDPGPQAVGFEIDACLRERNGEVACAHGP